MTDDWRANVYTTYEKDYCVKEWRKLRSKIYKRDGYYCQRCDTRFYVADISVHHIIPRDQGGDDVESNLITLCHPCHDYVELNDLFSRAAIMGSYDYLLDTDILKAPEEEGEDRQESFDRPAWHAYVYGCGKK